MKTQTIKSNILLLLAAAIWGFSFVAQRVGIKYMGPFTFNGIRFMLGSLSLLPLIFFYNRRAVKQVFKGKELKKPLKAGFFAGLFLFLAASLQQIGLVDTTAGKAAFITGLYIVIVPVLGIFLKHRVSIMTWFSAFIAIIGLYLLCVTDVFYISYADFLIFIGAFFWAVHLLIIDHFSSRVDAIKLAFFQFITCSVLSMVVAIVAEKIDIGSIFQAAVPILYGGICSVGIAFTLQIVGQKNVPPSHAALILSMETVFAVIGGFIILDERLGISGIIGCALILTGILLSQFQSFKMKKTIAPMNCND